MSKSSLLFYEVQRSQTSWKTPPRGCEGSIDSYSKTSKSRYGIGTVSGKQDQEENRSKLKGGGGGLGETKDWKAMGVWNIQLAYGGTP